MNVRRMRSEHSKDRVQPRIMTAAMAAANTTAGAAMPARNASPKRRPPAARASTHLTIRFEPRAAAMAIRAVSTVMSPLAARLAAATEPACASARPAAKEPSTAPRGPRTSAPHLPTSSAKIRTAARIKAGRSAKGRPGATAGSCAAPSSLGSVVALPRYTAAAITARTSAAAATGGHSRRSTSGSTTPITTYRQ